MASADPQALVERIEALELALDRERKLHVANLREIASAAGLREAHAMSLLAGCRRDGEQHPNGGPGMSPTDADSRKPPQGAQDPSTSKLDRWLSRSRQAGDQGGSANGPVPEGSPAAPKSKLDRWLARSQGSATPPDQQPVSKLDRWLSRAQGGSGQSPASCPNPQTTWESSNDGQSNASEDGTETKLDELMSRIRESWTPVDSALSILQEDRSAGDDTGEQGKDEALCHRCQGALDDDAQGAKRDGGEKEGTRMGIRMEEKSRGLTVTHVVPGGQGGQAGLQVKDVIKCLNSRPVKSLKSFAQQVKESGDVVCLEVIRGSGSNHRQLTIYSRTRPPSPEEEQEAGSGSGGEGDSDSKWEGKADTQEVLLEKFLKARRDERDKEKEANHEARKNDKVLKSASPGVGSVKTPSTNPNKAFNKYGKDTKLWVPESDEVVVADLPRNGDRPNKSEVGGFFMFPPGHPDHVPLPPGEAALIAGRSDVHPSERLAPHWSHIIFVSPSGAEIRAQARHATYGTIEDISGKMVHADPLTAHTDLVNSEAVKGSVAYIKRGGAPFTKKARVAVAAGAIACVVANSDRETFGMSYTDDGLPFAALNIPCVMISSDIVSKLEASDEWSVTLVPAKPEQQGTKKPPPPQPRTAANGKAQPEQPPSPPAAATGLKGLETLPINPNGANLGKPGKKPTMWKKIKLMLP
eukprot:CAMPEP_0181310130 /NCGR_PEP_ID=MMETSP1101-20121128/12417_1 /TAXON_ID=46948 /ORGANISM="Rhodomonas abbreviata, Strain Caron Lab Isolate" /LENGTH=694 /DNA_ID=CAMNT_0023416729 /DNA_START=137 /DNA_END=2221 /DNA_ORIENTATION=-